MLILIKVGMLYFLPPCVVKDEHLQNKIVSDSLMIIIFVTL
jgi:hypothetical protein